MDTFTVFMLILHNQLQRLISTSLTSAAVFPQTQHLRLYLQSTWPHLMASIILEHSLIRIRWYRVNRPLPSATPSPSNPAGEKRKKAKSLKRREAGQSKSASDMAQGLAPGHVRFLSDKRCSPAKRINTHESACFNPDSHR